MSDVEHLSCVCYVCLLWRNVYLVLSSIFLIGSFIFLELSCISCLYILEINSLSVASFAIIFSHSEGCLFTLLIVSFVVQQVLILRPCVIQEFIKKHCIQNTLCFPFNSRTFSSVVQSCPTPCDPMNRSMPGLPVHHHQLPEFTQTHAHRVSDTIQPSHPLSSPSPPAPDPSQHQYSAIKKNEIR